MESRVTVCIPTFRKYDLCRELISSAEAGSRKPDQYCIFDNGARFNIGDYPDVSEKIRVIYSGNNRGVAAAWNAMIKSTEDIRIICNDDIRFHENTIQCFVDHWENNKLMYPAHKDDANMFSCFSVADYIYQSVGDFDEDISPNYGYFEDDDWSRRLLLLRDKYGINYKAIPCGYSHFGSATLKSMNGNELNNHHNKFRLAQANFRRKWGGDPNQEIYTTPYNRGYW